MRKFKKKFKKFKSLLPYAVVGIATLVLVFVGSMDKNSSGNNLSLDLFADNNSNISVDQMSEMYMVADLSNALGLASSSDVASSYVMVNSMYESGQTASGKLEKPNLSDVNINRGIIEHTVVEGENVDAIAKKYGVTADQVRWSNGLKDTTVAVGTVLKIPSTPGIVYKVKSGDTVDSIVKKYGSNAAEIIALNDLENSGISEGMNIIIKGGSLPTTERPEYVPPRRYPTTTTTTTTTYTYTYLGNASSRTNVSCNRGLGAGQCTSWGWLKRPDLGFIKANANRWDDIARANGRVVNRTPSAGAIFQTDSGWYGHVGYVESVNADGSINISERNYAGCYGVLFSTIPAGEVGRFNYIH